MMNGEMIFLDFDVAVEPGVVTDATTQENPEPHDEPATILAVYSKVSGHRTAAYMIPLGPVQLLQVSRDLARHLPDELRDQLISDLAASKLIVARSSGDVERTASALRGTANGLREAREG
jgi:hypothetical protein